MTKPNWDLHHLPWGVGLTCGQIKVYDPTDDTAAYPTLPLEDDKTDNILVCAFHHFC